MKIFDVVDAYELLRDVLTVHCEHLDALMSAIGDIHEPIVGHRNLEELTPIEIQTSREFTFRFSVT